MTSDEGTSATDEPAVGTEPPQHAALASPDTVLAGADARGTRRRRRKWPWVVAAIVVVVVVGGWFAFNAVGADWIATNGKDTTAVGPCPFTNCTEVTYTGRLGAWYAPATPGHPTVVMVHGYGANRTDHSTVLVALQRMGYGIMAIDLGYEGNDAADSKTYGGGIPEAGYVKDAVAYAHAHGATNVVLLGYSAGGPEAILAASEGAHVAAIVSDSGPVSFVHLAADRIGVPTWLFTPASWMYSWFSTGGTLGSLSSVGSSYHTPTLVIQGTADQTVDPSNGAAVRNLTHGTLWMVPGVGHTGTAARCPANYVGQLNSFYSAALSGGTFTLNPAC